MCHASMSVHGRVHGCVCACACMCMCACACMCVHACVCMCHASMCVHVYVCMCMCVRIFRTSHIMEDRLYSDFITTTSTASQWLSLN